MSKEGERKMKLQINVECRNLDKEAVFKLVELLEGSPNGRAETKAEEPTSAEKAEEPAPLAHEMEDTGAEVTLEDLATAARPLLDDGKHEDVRALLTRYSVKSLPELKESQRIDFLRELKSLREGVQ